MEPITLQSRGFYLGLITLALCFAAVPALLLLFRFGLRLRWVTTDRIWFYSLISTAFWIILCFVQAR